MSFPLTMPESACAAACAMTLSRVVGTTVSLFTFEEQLFLWPGERWSVDFRMPPMTDADVGEEWLSFALRLKGMYGTFLMGDPSSKTPRGVATGTPLVDGAGQVGGTLDISGATANTDGWMKVGDYFQVGTGTSARLHKLTRDADTDSSGNVTLEFVPDLRYSPADNAPIVVTNAKGLFRMTSNETSWSREPGGIYRYGFTAQESL